jgi:hypothetical protein
MIRSLVRKETEKKREVRNGIVWSVDLDERTCRVKIQGSNYQIVAWYPENWEKTPQWLKKGNAVTIIHNGGRGRVEVLGHGQVIPSPVGGADQFPGGDGADDAILSGMYIIQTNPLSTSVRITAGTFRIDDITYSFPLQEVDLSSYIPSSSEQFRYVYLVVGSDVVVDVVQGSIFTSESTEPETPGGHLYIGKILLQGEKTEITTDRINYEWEVPEATRVDLSVNDTDLTWTQLTTQMTATVYDQYNNDIPAIVDGTYIFTLSFLRGNGQLYSTQSGWNTSEVTQTVTIGSYVLFTYKRNQTVSDNSPQLQLHVETSQGRDYYDWEFITLRDESGDIMVSV